MNRPLALVCRVGQQWLAFPAADIEAVVITPAIVPVPLAPPCVRGIVAIRSRLFTLLDTPRILGVDGTEPANLMAIAHVDGHGYGLSIHEVADVVEVDVEPLPARLAPQWSGIAGGVADHEGMALIHVEPVALIAAISPNVTDAAA